MHLAGKGRWSPSGSDSLNEVPLLSIRSQQRQKLTSKGDVQSTTRLLQQQKRTNGMWKKFGRRTQTAIQTKATKTEQEVNSAKQQSGIIPKSIYYKTPDQHQRFHTLWSSKCTILCQKGDLELKRHCNSS